MSARSMNDPIRLRTITLRKWANRETHMSWLDLVERMALAFAPGRSYLTAFWQLVADMNAAKSRPLQWMSDRNPSFSSSCSRRSVMAISVGHFMATCPSSVGNVWTGSPSTLPPPSTPRVRAIHPYLSNASVTRVAYAHAAFIHRYLSWSVPSAFSSKLNSATLAHFSPYTSRASTRGQVRATYRESSASRNDFHAA